MRFRITKKTDTFDYEYPRSCKNCGNNFQGRFCNRCGEKIIESQERSFVSLLNNILNAFTFLEGKVLISIKLILTNPGLLSRNIVDGIRVPYMKIVSLFFVANFFYFLFPIFESFNTSFYSQYRRQFYSTIAQRLVSSKLAEQSITLDELETAFNVQSSDYAKIFIIVIVFLFSLVLLAVNRKRDFFYSDHLTVAFEFMSFTLIFSTILFSAFIYSVVKIGNWLGSDFSWLFTNENVFILPVILVLSIYFLMSAQRNFYGDRWMIAALKSFLLFVGVALTLVFYRFLLFVITLWSL